MNRILIIEDDAVARRQLAQLFRFEEFEVIEAESGKAGITAASHQPPDLVVCDIMMPGTDGFGVLQALRKTPETSLTPFIFLTAKAGGHDVREGMGQGADDYITKPFDPDALLASARQRLVRRRLQLEEAERRANATGVLAATALPREMEGCLAHIETISDMLASKYGRDPQAVEMQKAMRAEVARLRTLSQRLRLYGELPSLYAQRFSATNGAPDCSPPDVAVEAARTIARQWARMEDLAVTTTPGSAPVPADTLAILTRELVDNACKFSPPATPIELDIRSEPAYWKLSIADRGPGMPPRQIREVGAFKQFWNGTERPGGLGLGLVLVQALARLHSGETLIDSEPHVGTRITVMIPTE
jgi:two-component system, sensor histidine kinase and response regulator